ncbi:MAG: HAD family hydrolase [Bacteroidaceae bacterium]|nr:HAD family hydrolase [Bacteroidaceae bacterium]
MRTFILDFDGTIADTQSFIVHVMQLTLKERGAAPRTPAQCAATIGLPLTQCFEVLLGIPTEEAQPYADTYRRIFDEERKPGAVQTFPHVVETIKALHQRGCRVTIATSRGRESLEHFIDDFQLNEYIAYTVCVGETEQAKPHPAPVLKTLEYLHEQPENALVVGDTIFDIAMGQGAGCPTCGVTYGNQTRSQLEAQHPTYLIDDFAELLNLA